MLAACALLGQDAAFDRLKGEAARMRALSSGMDTREFHAGALAPLHLALRDWIESQLPQKAGTAAGEFRSLEAALRGKLRDARLSEPDTSASAMAGPEGPGTGYVSLELKQLPEVPDALFAIASVTVECGDDEAVYLYHFGADGRTRVLEGHPGSETGYFEGAQIELYGPDDHGRRLLVTHYTSTQCGSVWMGAAYSVYRLDVQRGASELLLADEVVFRLDFGLEFVPKPEEPIIEAMGFGVDPANHMVRRTIYRYGFSQGVQRLDPVALQPQDFAEEWLTRPWSEMQSRSAGDTRDWHERLHSDSIGAHYSAVVQCSARSGRWLIGLDIDQIGEKGLPDVLRTWFLVRDLGNYRYNMETVGASRPAGCPGAGLKSDAIDKHPRLSREQLRALQ